MHYSLLGISLVQLLVLLKVEQLCLETDEVLRRKCETQGEQPSI